MPWFSLAAPVVGSLVLWFVTKQPTVLLFALLGPLAMLGSRWDSRRAQRRAERQSEIQRDSPAAQSPERLSERHVLREGEVILGTDAAGRAVVADSQRVWLEGQARWRASFERYLEAHQWSQPASSVAATGQPVVVDVLPEIGHARIRTETGEFQFRCALLNAASLEELAQCTHLPEEVAPPAFDLLSHGPHAWVMGMTGSGKTELMVSWLFVMAEKYSPAELNVLLIDFKGGGSYRLLEGLPHCVGLMTDLNETEASRVLRSLNAELTRREALLHEASAGDVAELAEGDAPARLVIVVDEFRAMLDTFAEMRAVFADIAARGRALGVHLILASQRATGAAGDALLANCGLRISMRVTDALESQLVLGSPRAAQLAHVAGRGVAVGTGMELSEFQARWMSPEEKQQRLSELARKYADHSRPQRPWLPALPHHLPWAEVIEAATGGDCLAAPLPAPLQGSNPPNPTNPSQSPAQAILGRSDDPEHQRQPLAEYVPERDGHLLIRGPAQSGKTTVAQLVSAQSSVDVHDDLDLTLASLSWDKREQFVAELTRRLRTAPTADERPVIICWPAHLAPPPWLEACRARLELTGETPGRASWKGLATQLVASAG